MYRAEMIRALTIPIVAITEPMCRKRGKSVDYETEVAALKIA